MHFFLTVFRNGNNRDHRIPHWLWQCCGIFNAIINKSTLFTHTFRRADQIALCMELNNFGNSLKFFKSSYRIAEFLGTIYLAPFRRVALKVQ